MGSLRLISELAGSDIIPLAYEGATIENMITHGYILTVGYAYDLIEEDGTFTFGLNFCLGFADGGQYVRSTTVSGDGAVAFETEEAWLEEAAAFWGAAK